MGKNMALMAGVTLLIIIVLGGLGVLLYTLVLPQAVVQNEYICPQGFNCQATPIYRCEQASGTSEVVVARTDDLDYSEGWIAYQNEFGGLNSWVNPLAVTRSTISGNEFDLPFLARAFFHSGSSGCLSETCLYVIREGEPDKYYRYKEGGGADINPVPQYDCQSQEICSGQVPQYNCQEKEVNLNDDVVYTFPAWESSQPTPEGGLIGETLFISGGDRVNYFGEIEYEQSTAPITSCIVQTQDGDVELQQGGKVCEDANTLVTCVDPPSTSTEYRDPAETTARCVGSDWVDAYTVDLDIDETVISLDDSFMIDFDLNDDIYPVAGRTVMATLYEGSHQEDTTSRITDAQGRVELELFPENTGYKTIEIFMTHPDIDYEPEPIDVQVTGALSVTTFRTISPQYDNNDVEIIVEVTKDGQAKDIVDWMVEDLYNGDIVSYDAVYGGAGSGERGTYHFLYDLQGDGNLQFKVRVQDNTGFWSEWSPMSGYEVVEVRKAELLLTNLNFPFSECSGRTHATTFTLVDSTGNTVDGATFDVTITQAVPTKPDLNPSVSGLGNGRYSFTALYEDGGNYYIDIFATKGGLAGSSQDNPVSIIVCGGSGGDDGGIDWTLYGVAGGALLAVISFVYFVFFFRRKK